MKKYYQIEDLTTVSARARFFLKWLVNNSETLVLVLGVQDRLFGVLDSGGINTEKFYSVGYGKRSSKTQEYISLFNGTDLKGGRAFLLPQYFLLSYLVVKHPNELDVFYVRHVKCSRAFIKRNLQIFQKHRRKLIFDKKIQTNAKVKDAIILLSAILKSNPDFKILNQSIREFKFQNKVT